jgi:hypothetical protein
MERLNRLEPHSVKEQKSFEKGVKRKYIEVIWETGASDGNSRDDIFLNFFKRSLSETFFKRRHLKNARYKVAALFGEDTVGIVDVLKGIHEIIDVEIANTTQIPLKTVRKALYRLYDHSLVALRQRALFLGPLGSSYQSLQNP